PAAGGTVATRPPSGRRAAGASPPAAGRRAAGGGRRGGSHLPQLPADTDQRSEQAQQYSEDDKPEQMDRLEEFNPDAQSQSRRRHAGIGGKAQQIGQQPAETAL